MDYAELPRDQWLENENGECWVACPACKQVTYEMAKFIKGAIDRKGGFIPRCFMCAEFMEPIDMNTMEEYVPEWYEEPPPDPNVISRFPPKFWRPKTKGVDDGKS